MPEFLIASPFKWKGEIKQQGLITLTAEEAEPMVCSGSLVPVLDGVEMSDSEQLYTLDLSSGAITPVSAGELQSLVVDSAATDTSIFIVAKGRTVERNGESFSEFQPMLLAPEEAISLINSGDVLGMVQVEEMLREAELAKEARLAEEKRLANEEAARLEEEKRKADETARLAQEQKDNKKKAKGDAAQS